LWAIVGLAIDKGSQVCLTLVTHDIVRDPLDPGQLRQHERKRTTTDRADRDVPVEFVCWFRERLGGTGST
jgi:hypothetical protein